MSMTRHGILVGVTGAGENTSALRWAADVALADHLGVTLVHAVNPFLTPPPPSVLVSPEPLLDVGRALLRESVEEYNAIARGPECRSILHTGAPAPVLT